MLWPLLVCFLGVTAGSSLTSGVESSSKKSSSTEAAVGGGPQIFLKWCLFLLKVPPVSVLMLYGWELECLPITTAGFHTWPCGIGQHHQVLNLTIALLLYHRFCSVLLSVVKLCSSTLRTSSSSIVPVIDSVINSWAGIVSIPVIRVLWNSNKAMSSSPFSFWAFLKRELMV